MIQDLDADIPFVVDDNIHKVYTQLKDFKKDLLIGLMLPYENPSTLGNEISRL